jgi:RND family efflux transporter MFP subunit
MEWKINMSRKKIYWFVIICVVALTVWAAYFRQVGKKDEEARIVPVEINTVSTGSIEQTIEATGWIEANSVVTVKSKVPGRIESLQLVINGNGSVPIEEGVEVEKGQQICQIDHDVYVAHVAAAKATVEARKVELADAVREKERMSKLFESGSATAQTRDKAITAADLATANLASAKANLELAEINLRESSIVSPIDGVVTAKYIDEGNLIGIDDPIVKLADIRTVKVVVALAEKYATATTAGMPVRISVDAFAGREFDANVYSVYPALDEQTRTLQVEARLDNERMLLKPGMFARVILITRRADNAVVISRDVVLGGKVDEPYVYVVEGQTARKRIIKTGITQADRLEVVEGLKAGEKLVVNGMQFLKDGIDVEVVRLKDVK